MMMSNPTRDFFFFDACDLGSVDVLAGAQQSMASVTNFSDIVQYSEKVCADANVEAFGKMTLAVWTALEKLFPECTKTRLVVQQIRAMFGNPVLAGKFVETWHTSMSTPVSEKLSYGNAFVRLTGRKVDYYACAFYRDHSALFANETLSKNMDCDLLEKFESTTFKPHRKALFIVLDRMNDVAQRRHGRTPEACPSREEISTNIQEFKAMSASESAPGGRKGDAELSVGMLVEVVEALLKTADAGDAEQAHSALREIEGDPEKFEMSTLADALSASGVKSLAQKGDFSAIVSIDHVVFRSLQLGQLQDKFTTDGVSSFCSGMAQYASFSAVTSHIPSSLLSSIREQAGSLSQDIVDEDGKVDFGKLNIAELGASLMKDVNPGELQDLAANLGNIVPDIKKLSESMPEYRDNPQLAQMMQGISAASAMSGAGAGGDAAQGLSQMMQGLSMATPRGTKPGPAAE
jgi:hypothetical protein